MYYDFLKWGTTISYKIQVVRLVELLNYIFLKIFKLL